MKALLLLLLLTHHGKSHANPSTDNAIAARAQAMQTLQGFHPGGEKPAWIASLLHGL